MSGGALERAAARGFDDYDPYEAAAAVNELHPLGKEGALAAVEQAHAGGDAIGLFWVLRVLFDVPDGRFPPVRLGEPTIPPPEDDALPRFPIVLVQELPLLVVRGYTLAGLPEDVGVHVDYYRAHGELRPGPLAPGDDAEAILGDFVEIWSSAYGEDHHAEAVARVREQLRT